MNLVEKLDARIAQRTADLTYALSAKLRKAADEIAAEANVGIHGVDLIGLAASQESSVTYCRDRIRGVLADRLAKELIA